MPTGLPTIVVVDDAEGVRLLLKMRFRRSDRLEVVGEGSDGAEAIALAREHQPALMLLDVSMPGMDGLTALPKVLEASPKTHVVLFTGFEEQGLLERGRELGASAFVEKSVPVESLIERLVGVLSDGPADVDAPGASQEPARRPTSVGDQAVLDEHLERFREVFDEAAIGMATMTLAGTMVRANRALARLVRRPVEELVGLSYASLWEQGVAEMAAALKDIRSSHLAVIQLEHGIAGSSEQLRMRATLAPVRDSEGRPLYIFLQVEDVTMERAALEARRKSEERFRLLVETVQDYAIFMLDPSGRIASWNLGAERSKGYTAADVIGEHFRLFYPPEKQRERHPEHELEVALRDGQYAEEGWRIRKDGSRFWASVVITTVYDEDHRHMGFAKVTRDITERRDAEEVLRKSEERFRLLVETVQDYAIFMLDPTGHVVSWNAGAERSKGYTAGEIIGQHFGIFYPEEVRSRGHPENELMMALRDGRYEEEGWRIRKDGSRFWANVVITAVRDGAGRHVGFAKVTRDNSARRRLEEEREEALKELASVNSELASVNVRLQEAADDQAQFLAVTAHELRTPIGVLSGSAELLAQHRSDLDAEERGELLQAVSSSTVRLRRLLDDLLTASRLQSSGLDLRTSPVSVSELVSGAVATARRVWPDVELTTDVPTDVSVLGDQDRLAQALENLIGNAILHGVSPVRVSVRRTGTQVELRVSDHGPGVAERVRPRLFERFVTGLTKGGTGLGLFIVRELARAHGGDAFYELPTPEVTAGVFVLRLPVAAE